MKKQTLFAAMLAVLLVAIAVPVAPASALDRDELVSVVALEAGISDAEARRAVAAIFSLIIETVSTGEFVLIEGFGGFRTTQGRSMKSPIFVPDNFFRNAVK